MTDQPERKAPSSYESAGVNLTKAGEAVERIAARVRSTYTPRVISGVGPFASLFDIANLEADFTRPLAHPVLVSSTDGVGTKIMLHLEHGTYRAAGIDLVAMSSNDILTLGARPLFFLDYVACGVLDPEIVDAFVAGMAEACATIGAALIGGETAEMPGLYRPGDYDLSGFIVGLADLERAPGPHRVTDSDVLVGLPSSGPHSNGYSLIRKILTDAALDLSQELEGTGVTLRDAILAPTRLYHPLVMELLESDLGPAVHSAANITGGGFFENIPRALPASAGVVIEKDSYPVPPIFGVLERAGNVPEREMYTVFNMGIGFVLVVDRQAAADIVSHFASRGETAYIIGHVVSGQKERVVLV